MLKAPQMGTEPVSIEMKGATLSEVFTEIGRQTGLKVVPESFGVALVPVAR